MDWEDNDGWYGDDWHGDGWYGDGCCGEWFRVLARKKLRGDGF